MENEVVIYMKRNNTMGDNARKMVQEIQYWQFQ